ncbi:MAG: DUF499 domain-containing protein [Candidatus Sumerlaeota bacterium]|nr:DUF499 domain-containing protein [Candidatus Sumerlaeota bacterium]
MAYPFHPALLDLMRQRWASLPEYQRTRGALRFLAACLRACHKAGKSGVMLGPGDVLLSDHEARRALIKELGLMNRFDAVFQSDLVGGNSKAGLIDKLRAKSNPAEVGKNIATRLATAIFLYSFGGLKREGAGTAEMLPPGASEAELLSACVGPELDSLTAKACLAELRQKCLYLHFDGVRYCFKQDPNVTLLIEQEADAIARDEDLVTKQVREMLEERLAGHHAAIAWPSAPGEVPDEQPRFQIAYLPLDFATVSAKQQEARAMEMIEKYGSVPRKYRNGLALAVPSADQAESLRREVRYLLAVDRVAKAAKKHNLTKEQTDELRERKATHANAVESAFGKLYLEVWFPKLENSAIVLEKIAVGGRPLQTTLGEKRQAMIHERVLELIMQVQKKVFPTVKAVKIADSFKLGQGTPPTSGIKCADIVDGFYSFLGFTRLLSEDAMRKGIAEGVQEGRFGYITGAAPALDAEGKYQVARNKVRFETSITNDEVDLESGFIMAPEAIPAAAVAATAPDISAGAPGGAPTPALGAGVPPQPGFPPSTGPASSAKFADMKKVVDLSFRADRNQLFNAWSAIANLADMAGKVSVNIHAESEKGFDQSKLQNGVIEPLREVKS